MKNKAIAGQETIEFINGTAVLPNKVVADAKVTVKAGRITGVTGGGKAASKGATVVDAKGGYILPGFVDLHIHGGDGADFMDGDDASARAVTRCHARHGTTSMFPTTTTGSPEEVMAMIEACGRVMKSWTVSDGSTIPGVHLYGPFFAADKVGCHPKGGRRDPTKAEWDMYFNTGIISIATCAAELPGAMAFFKEANKRKCLITCGHSNASWPEMEAGFKVGVRHVDHFWCAMSSIFSLRDRFGTPMQASMAEYVLFEKGMSTEVLADGLHLSDQLLEFAYKMLGTDRLCLVTDASRAVDMPAGDYVFGPKKTGEPFKSDGKVGYIPGEGLASSIVGMDHMVRHMKKVTSAPLHDVIKMASLTPAVRAGVGKEVGSLEKGKRADVLVADKKLNIKRVFIGGEEFVGGK